VHVTGEPAGDGLATLELPTLSVEVEATAIPQAIEVSVEGAEEGAQVRAGEIALPAGSRLAGDPDAIIVVIATAGVADTGEEAAPEGDVVEEPAGETAGEG
jgi:large subunit ribosomal protein L25